MRVALTGTPGVGKTTLAAAAAAAGWHVVDLKAWAQKVGAVVGHDEADGADVLDTDLLARVFHDMFPGRPVDGPRDAGGPALHVRGPAAPDRLLVEGHLSHLLPVDVVWLVRLDPVHLRPRLEARGYRPEKVRENLEAEALDILLQEALDGDAPVLQRDGTRRTPQQLLQSFAEATFEGLKHHDLEDVDWSSRLPV